MTSETTASPWSPPIKGCEYSESGTASSEPYLPVLITLEPNFFWRAQSGSFHEWRGLNIFSFFSQSHPQPFRPCRTRCQRPCFVFYSSENKSLMGKVMTGCHGSSPFLLSSPESAAVTSFAFAWRRKRAPAWKPRGLFLVPSPVAIPNGECEGSRHGRCCNAAAKLRCEMNLF